MVDLNFMGFHQPAQLKIRGLPQSMQHPQILIPFSEKGHTRCRNDYMTPFPTLSFVKEVKLMAHNWQK